MVSGDIGDSGSVRRIQEFVRANRDIEIYEYVDRGYNGEVYFGKRIKMGDDIVLKFYDSLPDYDASEEAISLRNINHDNILKIWDLKFLPPNFSYFISPKIEGGDLQQKIDGGISSTKEVLEIVGGILLGLTELHSTHNMVHRDLKPGNILLDTDRNQAIIADLGAVKKIEDSNGFVTASKSTYYYLPPESIMADKYFYQSDIYQVGIILFQLLGGFFPLETPLKWLNNKERKRWDNAGNADARQTEFEKIIGEKITKSKLINTSKLPEYLDSAFKKLIRTATHFHYEKRFINPAMFLKEVHGLLRNCPDYIQYEDYLLIKHDNGKEFMLYPKSGDKFELKKRKNGSPWRKDNSHDGTFQSAIKIARKR